MEGIHSSAETLEEGWRVMAQCLQLTDEQTYEFTLVFTFYPSDGTVSVPRVAYKNLGGTEEQKKAIVDAAIRRLEQCTPIKRGAWNELF